MDVPDDGEQARSRQQAIEEVHIPQVILSAVPPDYPLYSKEEHYFLNQQPRHHDVDVVPEDVSERRSLYEVSGREADECREPIREHEE